MPIYFFDIEIAASFHQDARGMELPDGTAACRRALELARDEVAALPREQAELEILHVRDEQGRCLLRLPLCAAAAPPRA